MVPERDGAADAVGPGPAGELFAVGEVFAVLHEGDAGDVGGQGGLEVAVVPATDGAVD